MKYFKKSSYRQKYKICFGFQRISNVHKNKITLFVKWKRGKKYSDSTFRTVVANHTGLWNAQRPFTIRSTLFKSSKGTEESPFKEKYLNIAVHQVGGSAKKKGKVIGKLRIDVAALCNPEHLVEVTEKYPILLWSKHEAVLHIRFKTEVYDEKLDGARSIKRREFDDLQNYLSPSDARKNSNNRFIHLRSKSTNSPPSSISDLNIDIKKARQKERTRRRTVSGKTGARQKYGRFRSGRNRRRDGRSLQMDDEEPPDNLENVLKKLESSVQTPRNKPRFLNVNGPRTKSGGPNSCEVQSADTPSLRILGNASPVVRVLHNEPEFRTPQTRRNRRKSKKKSTPQKDEDEESEEFQLQTESDDDVEEKQKQKSELNSEEEAEGEEEEEEEEKEEGEDERELKIKSLQTERTKLRKKVKNLEKKVTELEKKAKQKLIIEQLIQNIISPVSSYQEIFPLSGPLLYTSIVHFKGLKDKELIFCTSLLHAIEKEVLKSFANQDLMLYWLSSCTTLLSIIESEFQCKEEEEEGEEKKKKNVFGSHEIFPVSLESQETFRLEVLKSIFGEFTNISFFRFDNPLTEFIKKLKILIFGIYVSVVHNCLHQYLKKQTIVSAFFHSLFSEKRLDVEESSNRDLKVLYGNVIKILRKLKDFHVFKPYVVLLMQQIFYYFDCSVFNTFVMHARSKKMKKKLGLDIGIQIKMNISQFESLISNNDYYIFSNANKESIIRMFGRTRDLCTIWMMSNKSILLDKSFIEEIQMVLNDKQMIKVLEIWNDLDDQQNPVSSAVIRKLESSFAKKKKKTEKVKMEENLVLKIDLRDKNDFRDISSQVYGWKQVFREDDALLQKMRLQFLEI